MRNLPFTFISGYESAKIIEIGHNLTELQSNNYNTPFR